MQVETFEDPEIATEPIEASEEARKIIETLKLDGQAGLLESDPKERKARPPYRKMTAEEFFIYSVLCPQKTKAKQYNASPIPLRVLQVMSHAINIFPECEIWDHASMQMKDPVLLGVTKHPQWTWQHEYFLLARWGEELESTPILLKKACDQVRSRARNALASIERSIQSHILVCESMTEDDLMKKGAEWQPEVKL